jgi:hypothetical protein
MVISMANTHWHVDLACQVSKSGKCVASNSRRWQKRKSHSKGPQGVAFLTVVQIIKYPASGSGQSSKMANQIAVAGAVVGLGYRCPFGPPAPALARARHGPVNFVPGQARHYSPSYRVVPAHRLRRRPKPGRAGQPDLARPYAHPRVARSPQQLWVLAAQGRCERLVASGCCRRFAQGGGRGGERWPAPLLVMGRNIRGRRDGGAGGGDSWTGGGDGAGNRDGNSCTGTGYPPGTRPDGDGHGYHFSPVGGAHTRPGVRRVRGGDLILPMGNPRVPVKQSQTQQNISVSAQHLAQPNIPHPTGAA